MTSDPYQPPTEVDDQTTPPNERDGTLISLMSRHWALIVLLLAGGAFLAGFLGSLFGPIPMWASMWVNSVAAIAMLWAVTRINRPRPG